MKLSSEAAKNTSYTTMESLALPKELIWDCKMEPTTPPPNDLFPIDWLYDDNFATGITIEALDFKLEDYPIEILSSEDHVVEYDLTNEHWNGAKLHSTGEQFNYAFGTPQDNGVTKVQHVFNGPLFDSTGLDNAILTQLTPPHSPPRDGGGALPPFQLSPNEQQILNNGFNQLILPAAQIVPPVDFVPAVQSNVYTPFNATATPNTDFSATMAPNTDFCDDNIELETSIDEIVNTAIKELLPDWNEESDTQSSYSNQSSFDTCTDEDWTPSAGSSPAYSDGGNAAAECDDTKKAAKKRTRPYGRGVEDRKIRKKEQNKNAATRYRQKKKLEMEVVLTEEQQLTQRNQELKQALEECEREEKYLTKLIREFYQKKRA